MPEEGGVRPFFVYLARYILLSSLVTCFGYVKVCAERSPEAHCIQNSTFAWHDCHRSRSRSKEKITNMRKGFFKRTERFSF